MNALTKEELAAIEQRLSAVEDTFWMLLHGARQNGVPGGCTLLTSAAGGRFLDEVRNDVRRLLEAARAAAESV